MNKSKPFSVSIETNMGCNLKCIGCEVGQNLLTRPDGYLSIEDYKNILSKIPSTIFHLNLYFQGEPLLNPYIGEMIKLAINQKKVVFISTNGTLLDENLAETLVDSRLTYIIFSIDGFDKESYEFFRNGGDLNKVLHNLQRLVTIKKMKKSLYPLIEIQTIITSANENHIKEFKKLAKHYKVDKLKFKTAYSLNIKQIPDYLPHNTKYSRYIIQNNQLELKQQKKTCLRLLKNSVITKDMDVLPCCYDKDAQYVMGNLKNKTFDEIWQNEIFIKFRHNILLNIDKPDICKNCV